MTVATAAKTAFAPFRDICRHACTGTASIACRNLL